MFWGDFLDKEEGETLVIIQVPLFNTNLGGQLARVASQPPAELYIHDSAYNVCRKKIIIILFLKY